MTDQQQIEREIKTKTHVEVSAAAVNQLSTQGCIWTTVAAATVWRRAEK